MRISHIMQELLLLPYFTNISPANILLILILYITSSCAHILYICVCVCVCVCLEIYIIAVIYRLFTETFTYERAVNTEQNKKGN